MKKGGQGNTERWETLEFVSLSPQSKRPCASVFPCDCKASLNPVSKSAGALKTLRSESQFDAFQIKASFILFLSVLQLDDDNLLPC